MKVRLEFNLPDQEEEYFACSNGVRLRRALKEVLEALMVRIKYAGDENVARVLESFRRELLDGGGMLTEVKDLLY